MSADLDVPPSGGTDAMPATSRSLADVLPLHPSLGALRRYATPVATTAVLGGFAITTATNGIPLERAAITAWCLLLVIATGIALPWRTLLTRITGWLAVYAAFMFYELARGVADALGTPVDFTGPMSVDVWLTGVVPTVWLQRHVYADGVQTWLSAPLGLLYMSHFLTAYAVMLWLQVRSARRFWPFVASWLVTTYVSCAIFLLHPSAPPWLAARENYIEPIRRTATIGLHEIHLRMAANLVDLGRATFNQVAAFPSLHAAYPALLLAFFWATSRWWLRALLAAYTVSMGAMLVLTGEHWVIDVLVGWTIAGCSVALVTAFPRRRTRRRLGAASGRSGRDFDQSTVSV